MSSYDNIYAKPAEYGLEIVASMDLSESYEFDIWVLFRNTEGMYFMAHDSGGSCPAPFENYISADQIADGRVFNVTDVRNFIASCGGKGDYATMFAFLKDCQVAGLSGDNVVLPS